MSEDGSTELVGWSATKPIRVAFLVEPSEHSALVLDGIFADCYSRWGGRFSLVVPCLNGSVSISRNVAQADFLLSRPQVCIGQAVL